MAEFKAVAEGAGNLAHCRSLVANRVVMFQLWTFTWQDSMVKTALAPYKYIHFHWEEAISQRTLEIGLK